MYYKLNIDIGNSENDFKKNMEDGSLAKEFQTESVILDTGSEIMSIPCKGCNENCGIHEYEPFFAEKSKTFKISHSCSVIDFVNICRFNRRYAEGSSIDGFLAHDYFHYRNNYRTKNKNLNKDIPEELTVMSEFGCTMKENGLFVSQLANGIFGLGNKSEYLESSEKYLKNEYKMNFGFCFSSKGGIASFDVRKPNILKTSLMGESIGKFKDVMTVARFDKNSEFYEIRPTLIKVGNSQPSTMIRDYMIMIDSGTTFLHVPDQIFDFIISEINTFCAHNKTNCGGVQKLKMEEDICFLFETPDSNYNSLKDLLHSFPKIELFILNNSNPIVINPSNYFYKEFSNSSKDHKKKKVCLAIKPGENDRIILGGFAMQEKYFYFDRNDSQVIIIPHSCSFQQEALVSDRTRLLAVESVEVESIVHLIILVVIGVIFLILVILLIFMLRPETSRSLSQNHEYEFYDMSADHK